MTEGDDRWIEIGRGSIHYRLRRADPDARAADRPPLVFLHEGLGSVSQWRSFPHDVRAALGGPTTLVFSRHGYGRSTVVPERRDATYLHDEALVILPALLDALSIDGPVLVGHSDGASIALIHGAAGRAVSGLVLLAPHVYVEQRAVDAITAARHAFEATDLPARLARHHDDAQATFQGWNDVWLSDGFRTWNIEDRLPAITAPVLAIQGDADEYGTLAQLDAVEAGVAGPFARVVVADAGHSPHLTAPEQCRRAIVDFVAALPSRQP